MHTLLTVHKIYVYPTYICIANSLIYVMFGDVIDTSLQPLHTRSF